MSNIIQKIFSNYLFKVQAAWFGVYIKDKVAASILEPVQQAQELAEQTIEHAQQIANHTIASAQDIADTFTIRNVGSQDNVDGIVNAFARDPETGESEHMRIVEQLWPGDSAVDRHTVYDNIMYIGGTEGTV